MAASLSDCGGRVTHAPRALSHVRRAGSLPVSHGPSQAVTGCLLRPSGDCIDVQGGDLETRVVPA